MLSIWYMFRCSYLKFLNCTRFDVNKDLAKLSDLDVLCLFDIPGINPSVILYWSMIRYILIKVWYIVPRFINMVYLTIYVTKCGSTI